MAVAGEPLKRRHAVVLYSAQSVKGTPVTPATAVGIMSPRAVSQSGMMAIFGMGSPSVLFQKPGMAQVPITLPIDYFQEKTFLTKAVRSSGTLPWLTIGLGYRDDAGTMYAWSVQDCKIHSVSLACRAGGPLTASFSGVGGLITDSAALAPTNLSQDPLVWYEGVMTKGGSAYEVESFEATINHNVDVVSPIPGTAPSTFKRGWKYQTEGNEDITGRLVAFAKSGINMQADTISSFALQAAFTDIAGGMSPNAATIAFAACKFSEEEMALADDIRFTTPFRAATWTVT